jgi:hypothetical protein
MTIKRKKVHLGNKEVTEFEIVKHDFVEDEMTESIDVSMAQKQSIAKPLGNPNKDAIIKNQLLRLRGVQ